MENNWEEDFDKLFVYTDFGARILNEDDVRNFIRQLLLKAKKEERERILKELSETHKENFAFMTMKNEKGELEDWTIPFTEIKKIIENV